MCEALLVACVTRFYKIVHIQLTHKRRKVVVFEILGKYFLCELIRLVYNEAVAFMVPVDTLMV